MRFKPLMTKISDNFELGSLENSKFERYNKKYIIIPTILVAYKINLNGRSILDRSKPRDTKKEFKYGNFKIAYNSIVQQGSYQKINDLGSINVSVKLLFKKV